MQKLNKTVNDLLEELADRVVEKLIRRNPGDKTAVETESETGIEINRVFVLSTAHASGQEALDRLMLHGRQMGLTVLGDEHMVLILTYPFLDRSEEPNNLPTWLVVIMRWAEERGAWAVAFDADGPVVDKFPTFNW